MFLVESTVGIIFLGYYGTTSATLRVIQMINEIHGGSTFLDFQDYLKIHNICIV